MEYEFSKVWSLERLPYEHVDFCITYNLEVAEPIWKNILHKINVSLYKMSSSSKKIYCLKCKRFTPTDFLKEEVTKNGRRVLKGTYRISSPSIKERAERKLVSSLIGTKKYFGMGAKKKM